MLKIKDNFPLEKLIDYGFEDSETSNNVPLEYWGYDKDYHFDNTIFIFIARGRRGQDYYLLIDKKSKILSIYATKPDGDGTCGEISDVIYDLIKADLVEKVSKE